MEHTSPYLIEMISKKLKVLTDFKGEKTRLLSESISIYLQKLVELKNYINENNKDKESKILFEVGKYLKYQKYQKGQFIRHSYDSDDYFYMIFSGDIAKINIKYNRLYLSFKEYLMYLIKLRLLRENIIYLKCLRKNQKVFPFDENMDILTTEDINIDHYQELINKIKHKINNSNWFTNNDENNAIEDLIKLYNPEIPDTRAAFLGKETKYPAYIPFYVFDKIMNPISFIGHLTKPKGIKFSSSYVCLNVSEIFYVNKTEIEQNSNLFKLFQNKVSENVIQKLFEGHFLFKDSDKNFLIKNYSKYFYIQRYIKGEKIIQQNTPYEGIYFIKKGLFQLKTFRSYNELNDLHFSILHAMDTFPKALIDFQSKINEFDKKNSKVDNENIFEGLNQIQIGKFTEPKNISFKTFVSPEVVGLNDLYDNKTQLNNFSVECISDEAEVYFLPKEIVTSMMADEHINSKASSFIGKQCMLLINEISKYKESFVKGLQLEKKKNNNLKEDHYKNINTSSYSLNIISLSNMRNESNISSLINLKQKKNYNTSYGNISNNAKNNFSTSKTIKSHNYFNTYNSSKIHNKSNSSKNNERFPKIFLSKVLTLYNSHEYDSKIKLPTDILNNDELCNKIYKSNLNINDENYMLKTGEKLNLNKIYLTDRENIISQKNIKEGNKKEFNAIKTKFITNFNDIKVNMNGNKLFIKNNYKYNKSKLRKYRSQQNANKNYFNNNNYEENKNSRKRPLKIPKNALNKKRLIKGKKYFLKNVGQ